MEPMELSKQKTTLILRIVWGLWAIAVIVGSLLPGSSEPMRLLDSLQISDKLEHFGAYAVLVFLPAIHERMWVVAIVAAGALLLGVGLEFGQLHVPLRTFDIADMVADACGVSMGLTIGIPMRPVARRAIETL